MKLEKKKKPLSNQELSNLKIKTSKSLEKLQSEYDKLHSKYLELGQNTTLRKKTKFRQLNQLSRLLTKMKIRIQNAKNELYHIDRGEVYRMNIFQKIAKAFSRLSYQKQKMVYGFLFALPWIIGFIIFFSSPLFTTIWWSLNEMSPKQGGGFNFNFVLFDNYRNLFLSQTLGGSTVLEVLTNSILDIVIDLPIILLFSIFIAVLLNTKFKGHQLVKAIFFIPVVYNMTVVNNTLSGTFGQLFESSLGEGFQLGQTFSNFLMQIGIGGGLIEFLMSAVDRIFLIVNKSGIQIIIFIAALQSIPLHLYESAKVEGATKYEMFWKVTIPMISPMVMTALVYTLVDSFGSSDIMNFLTVNSQGTTMATNLPGMYSTISIVYFLANIIIIAFAFLLFRKSVFYYE